MKMSRKRVKYARPSVLNWTHSLTVQRCARCPVVCFLCGLPSQQSQYNLASVIDAHPNAILAHEFLQLLKNDTHLTCCTMLSIRTVTSSHLTAGVVWTSPFKAKAMISTLSWQGRFRRLNHIYAGAHVVLHQLCMFLLCLQLRSYTSVFGASAASPVLVHSVGILSVHL